MALQDAPKTTPGRPQMALGPSEGQPLDRPRATLICKNQYNFNVCLKMYWFLHIRVALGPSKGDVDMQKPIQNKRALKLYWFLHIKVALGPSKGDVDMQNQYKTNVH